MKKRSTYTEVFFKIVYTCAAYTLMLQPAGFASDFRIENEDLGNQRGPYLTRLAIPEKTDPFSTELPNLRSCHDIIRAYIGKVIGQYKLKKMVINETDIGTFVVPSDSFITYMMIMTPTNFDRIYLPKFRDKKFNCTRKGESFKGVYHLY